CYRDWSSDVCSSDLSTIPTSLSKPRSISTEPLSKRWKSAADGLGRPPRYNLARKRRNYVPAVKGTPYFEQETPQQGARAAFRFCAPGVCQRPCSVWATWRTRP